MPRIAKDPVNDFVRHRIRCLRQSKRLSARQLAALSGIPEGSYCCLEGGHGRINLADLQRIMQALGTKIQEIWPRPTESFESSSSARRNQFAINRLRFREICSLTQADSAILLSRNQGRLEPLFEANLEEGMKGDLLQMLERGRLPGPEWRICQKTSGGKTLCLALRNAVLKGRLGVLLQLYLDLWLATQIAR